MFCYLLRNLSALNNVMISSGVSACLLSLSSVSPVSQSVSLRIATAIIPDESVTELLGLFRLIQGVVQSFIARDETLGAWLAAMVAMLASDWSERAVPGALLAPACRQTDRH